MQRLLPETAMKELHSQAPGGNEVETIRRHLAFGVFWRCRSGRRYLFLDCFCCITYILSSMCVCFLVGCIKISWWSSLYFDAHPFYLFHWLIVDVSTCFLISLGPLLLSITSPPCHWVVQIPGREKSSKWKYKEDEGGKKDAEKEKTRSREQEWSMNHIMNEWKFHCGLWLGLFPKSSLCHYVIMFFLFILRLVTNVLFQEH